MPIVKIVAGQPVVYWMSGITPTEFDDGELYDVPPHVAGGMMERGWAEIVTPERAQPDGLSLHPETAQPRQPSPEPPAQEDAGRKKKAR